MMASATDLDPAIDLAVDSSAVIAILLREEGYETILERLCRAKQPALAAPTRTELLMVASVRLGALGLERARDFLDMQNIVTMPLDEELADQAALAFERFGRGRHPSGLNYGDCFSYALAKQLAVPLLYIGNDFSQTDLLSALASTSED